MHLSVFVHFQFRLSRPSTFHCHGNTTATATDHMHVHWKFGIRLPVNPPLNFCVCSAVSGSQESSGLLEEHSSRSSRMADGSTAILRQFVVPLVCIFKLKCAFEHAATSYISHRLVACCSVHCHNYHNFHFLMDFSERFALLVTVMLHSRICFHRVPQKYVDRGAISCPIQDPSLVIQTQRPRQRPRKTPE